MLRSLGLILVLAATGQIGFGQDTPKPRDAECTQPGDRPPAVPVSQPVLRDITDFEDFAGRTDAVQSVNIAPRVTGYLTSASFKEGSDVKEGDVLFQIDPRPYQALVDQAQAEVRLNGTRLAAARTDLERMQELLKTAAISRNDLDKSKSAEQEAIAALDAAKASLSLQQLNLSFCTIVSPIGGRTGRFKLSPGNIVIADQTVLTTVVTLDPIYVSFAIDQRTLLRIRQGINEGKIKQRDLATDMPVLLGLGDADGFPYRGTINFVNNQVDGSTGTVDVRAVFANPQPKDGVRLFSPGMFVRVRLPIGDPHPALLVAESAVLTDQFVRYVYVVDPGDNVHVRRVRIGGHQDDDLRVVEEGLKQGDRVAVGKLPLIHANLKVRPEVVPMPTAHRDESAGPAGTTESK